MTEFRQNLAEILLCKTDPNPIVGLDYFAFTDNPIKGSREVHFFSSGCSERLKIFPSGSLNQATFAPEGEVQIPSSS